MIKGIIFDYGGTIDTDGVHWFELFRIAYSKFMPDVPTDVLREAYIFTERILGTENIIQPDDDFYATLLIKTGLQLDFLSRRHGYAVESDKRDRLINYCINYVRENIVRNSDTILLALSERFPLVIVSNFYGNMGAVLTEFGLKSYFSNIVESKVAGVRKPDPRIFLMGVKALEALTCGITPEQTLVVGDSFHKDIVPASSIGCVTVWLKNTPFGDDPQPAFEPSYTISSLSQLLTLQMLYSEGQS